MAPRWSSSRTSRSSPRRSIGWRPTYHWADLATVACNSGTLTVVLTDDGDGTLEIGSNAVRIERVQERKVPVGATVTFDAPSGSIVTAAGTLGAVSGQAVTLETDGTWFPYDADATRTMTLGYNPSFDQFGYPGRIYANRYRGSAAGGRNSSAGRWRPTPTGTWPRSRGAPTGC
jgi:hypothetical protein